MNMDISTIERASRRSVFEKRFKGVLFSDVQWARKISSHGIGDFYIVNTNHVRGIHWFSIVRGWDMWVIFDSSMDTPQSSYQNIVSRMSVPCIIDRGDLQGKESLLCGEFSLCSVALMGKLFIKMGDKLNHSTYPINYYSVKMLDYVKTQKCSTDEFVFDFVYKQMKKKLHISPENIREVEKWLCSF